MSFFSSVSTIANSSIQKSARRAPLTTQPASAPPHLQGKSSISLLTGYSFLFFMMIKLKVMEYSVELFGHEKQT
jgi:hypothetical protein